MRLPAVLFLVSTLVGGSVAIKTLVFPSATSTSYVEMVPLKPLNLRAFTLCMRVATELSGEQSNQFHHFQTKNTAHAATTTKTLDDYHRYHKTTKNGVLWLSFYMSGDGVFFNVPQLGALQTHLCVTWNSGSGAATLFVDGRKSLTKIYRKNQTVRPGGKVIIGQDPDNYVGDFDAKQSLVGEIGDISMWDSVLSQSAIQDLFSGKRVARGNVFDWETAQLEIHGDVEVVNVEL
ncbi:C-reactive protein-like [Lycodopsis pacificus]